MTPPETFELQRTCDGVIRSGAWLGRAELPERFDIIVTDYALATADQEMMKAAHDSWLAVKAELHRRNYTIWESRDEERRCFVATCAKRPNDQAQRAPD